MSFNIESNILACYLRSKVNICFDYNDNTEWLCMLLSALSDWQQSQQMYKQFTKNFYWDWTLINNLYG